MSAPLLVLVGLPGGGKSSVARELARLVGTPAHDTDTRVAEIAGVEPDVAFLELGEEAYRDLERDAVAELLAEDGDGGVVALGSGALHGPHGADNRDAVDAARRRGTRVVDLDVRLSEAAPRSGLLGAQPVGLGAPRALLARFAQERRPDYLAVADLTMDTTGRTAPDVARDLQRWLEKGRRPAASDVPTG